MHTENPGHETDHQELGPGQCHHYVHKPNPVYQIDPISGEHRPSELSARIPDYRRYSPMGAPGCTENEKGRIRFKLVRLPDRKCSLPWDKSWNRRKRRWWFVVGLGTWLQKGAQRRSTSSSIFGFYPRISANFLHGKKEKNPKIEWIYTVAMHTSCKRRSASDIKTIAWSRLASSRLCSGRSSRISSRLCSCRLSPFLSNFIGRKELSFFRPLLSYLCQKESNSGPTPSFCTLSLENDRDMRPDASMPSLRKGREDRGSLSLCLSPSLMLGDVSPNTDENVYKILTRHVQRNFHEST